MKSMKYFTAILVSILILVVTVSAANPVPQPGLMAYYNFNNTTEMKYGAWNLSVYAGAPTFTEVNAFLGKSGRLTNGNQWKIFDAFELEFVGTGGNASTISFWFYEDDAGVNPQYILNNYAGGGNGWYINSGADKVKGSYFSAPDFDSGAIINDTDWTYVVLVRNDTPGQTCIYINAVLEDCQNNVMTEQSSDQVTIGALATDGSGDVTGLIDELSFYNITLNQTNIDKMYNGGVGITFLDTPATSPANSTAFIINSSADIQNSIINSGVPATPATGVTFLNYSGTRQIDTLISFNLSSAPPLEFFTSAELRLVIQTNNIDAAEGYTVSSHHIYDNYEVNETNSTWNNGPIATTNYNTTSESSEYLHNSFAADQLINWSVTAMLDKSNDTLALRLLSNNGTIDSITDFTVFRDKSDGAKAPMLLITYDYNIYNSTTYGTATERYIGYKNYNSTLYNIYANITWNGTIYNGTNVGSGDDAQFSWGKTMPAMTNPENVSFYWTTYLVNKTDTSDVTIQNISVPQNVSIQNVSLFECKDPTAETEFAFFDFKDGLTEAALNATIVESTWNYYLGNGSINQTLSFSNSTLNLNYSFCFSENLTLHNGMSMSYANSPTYPTQIYSSGDDLTNVTTNTTLVLNDVSTGSYISFNVQTNNGNGLEGVSVGYERKISGSFVFQGTDQTDGSGTVTFFLDYNTDYRFTFTRSGYVTETLVVRPTQSLYTVTLQATGGGSRTPASYFSPIANISYTVTPVTNEPLDPNVTQTFGFNIYSSTQSLTYYMFNLTNASGFQLASLNGTNSLGANITVIGVNVSGSERVIGYYWADAGNGTYLLNKQSWIVGDFIAGNSSIKTGLDNIAALDLNAKEKYTMLFFLFFIGFILLAGFTRLTGVELTNPGMSFLLVGFIVFGLTLGGVFTITFSPIEFVNQFGVFLVYLCGSAGFYLGVLNRS